MFWSEGRQYHPHPLDTLFILHRQPFPSLSTICLPPTLIIVFIMFCWICSLQACMITNAEARPLRSNLFLRNNTFLRAIWFGSEVYLHLTTDKWKTLSKFFFVWNLIAACIFVSVCLWTPDLSCFEKPPAVTLRETLDFCQRSSFTENPLSLFHAQSSGNNKPEKTKFNEATWLHQSFC